MATPPPAAYPGPAPPPPSPLGFLELMLAGAEATPDQKQREPTGADPYAVLHYGEKQFFVARLMKGTLLHTRCLCTRALSYSPCLPPRVIH